MQIRRFGVGHRRPDGPAGTTGVAGQIIHTDGRGVISELAFAANAKVESHSSPNTTWFIVIEGGGFVAVGDERARVAAGEAVLWPAGLIHAAWTDRSQMRAIVVELAGADDGLVRGLLEAGEPTTDPGDRAATEPITPIERGIGTLAEPHRELVHDLEAGEPL